MPKFTSVVSGVSVSVDDDTAELLGSEWEPAEDETKKRSSSKSSK